MENVEIWKAIENFDGYEASNMGNIRSLKWNKIRVLKGVFDGRYYLQVRLYRNGKPKTRKIHQLIAEVFLNHKPCGYELVVNHIDFNGLNNKVDNLEIITQRENANRKHLKSTSIYTGVCWCKSRKKWQADIRIKNKNKGLGYFINEIDAHNAYQNELKKINEKTN